MLGRSSLPQTMMSGMGRFVLIALPLFVLAGGLMNAGGISGRLFDFARALVGSLRGGLAHVRRNRYEGSIMIWLAQVR